MAEGRWVELGDGRRLGFAEYGAPGGAPLFFLPGMPGSRVLGRVAARPARERDMRVLALDRPGIGLSDPRPERTILDTADDVAALADSLKIGVFDGLGVSDGAPHALACAWMLPQRVRRVALLSSLTPRPPSVDRGARAQVPKAVRRAIQRGVGDDAERPAPGFVLQQMERTAAPADRAVLSRRDVRELLTEVGEEAFRLGTRAVAQEARLGSRPWGFRPEDITVEASLWHGIEDRTVPVLAARQLAPALPSRRATFLEGVGHLLLFDHLEPCDQHSLPPRCDRPVSKAASRSVVVAYRVGAGQDVGSEGGRGEGDSAGGDGTTRRCVAGTRPSAHR